MSTTELFGILTGLFSIGAVVASVATAILMKKIPLRYILMVGIAICLVLASITGTLWAIQTFQAHPSTPSIVTDTEAPTSVMGNLEDDSSQWQIFYQKTAKATLQKITKPSIDGSALQISLLNSDPNALTHVYRNLPIANGATTFELNFYFLFTSPGAVHSLYFSMSKWIHGQRWEWALLWQHFNNATSQQGWYIWDGSNVQSLGVSQQLSANTWHFFHLYGDIFEGKVHYIAFASDGTSVNLGQMYAPVPQTQGDKLTVAIQLDSDNQGNPYQIDIDNVDLLWG